MAYHDTSIDDKPVPGPIAVMGFSLGFIFFTNQQSWTQWRNILLVIAACAFCVFAENLYTLVLDINGFQPKLRRRKSGAYSAWFVCTMILLVVTLCLPRPLLDLWARMALFASVSAGMLLLFGFMDMAANGFRWRKFDENRPDGADHDSELFDEEGQDVIDLQEEPLR
ncbi:hypothetical protein BC831DRAFT_478869, partial [Entophlyctis helioformis]